METTQQPQSSQANPAATEQAEKIYIIGGIEYRLKPLDLNFANAMCPFRTALNKRMYFHTSGIPMEDVNDHRERINEIQTAHSQYVELSSDETKDESERIAAVAEAARLYNALTEANADFENDEYCQRLIALHNACCLNAFEECCTDVGLLKSVLPKILIGDVAALQFDVADYKAIQEVLRDAQNFITEFGNQ